MKSINDNPFTPHKIIKVYNQIHTRNYYLEQCDVTVVDGEAIVGPGKPLSKTAVRRIAGSASKEQFNQVLEDPIMDPGILYFNPLFHKRFILWYRPQKRKVFNVRNDEYSLYMPAMLFMVVFDKLYLFSMKSSARPKLGTKLYVAPLLNLSDSTHFCWGSVKVSKNITNIDEEVRFWERNIWKSEFSHVGTKCSNSEIMSIYKKLNKTDARFPKNELLDIEMTLEQAIKQHRP